MSRGVRVWFHIMYWSSGGRRGKRWNVVGVSVCANVMGGDGEGGRSVVVGDVGVGGDMAVMRRAPGGKEQQSLV